MLKSGRKSYTITIKWVAYDVSGLDITVLSV
jgi:hypothetical protein